MFDNNEVKQLLEQEYKDKDENNYIFLGMNLDDYKMDLIKIMIVWLEYANGKIFISITLQ